MCGRFALDVETAERVRARLGIPFEAQANDDVRPTNTVATVAMIDGRLQQLNTHWGIKPSWASHLLINAKAETVATKKTFAKAFAERRCLVPMSGWYEWRDEGGPRKAKYLFQAASGIELYMAGIWYPPQPSESTPALVTLTTAAKELLAQYHDRVPLLINPENALFWLRASPERLPPLLDIVHGHETSITKC